ncbi:MAG: hypothetical protein QM747_21555 [Nocardioides sp.]
MSGPVSRRTVTRGAAWTVPVVASAVAAPAYAVTSGACTDSDHGLMPLSGWSGKVTWGYFAPSQLQVDMGITAVRGGVEVADPYADKVTGRVVRQTGLSYLKLHQPAGMHQGDTMTLTFENFLPTVGHVTSVRNLQLTLTGVDKVTGQWIDEVSFDPPPSLVVSRGAAVIGTGTSSDPFRSNREGAITGTTDGDVTVVWSTAVSIMKVIYRSADASNASSTGQFIGVGNISYSNC